MEAMPVLKPSAFAGILLVSRGGGINRAAGGAAIRGEHMDTIEALKSRRSVREFDAKPVSREIIETIVDCGRLAASARNMQPWEFVAVTEAEQRRRIADATEHGKHIATAPVCIAVLCKDSPY